MKWPRRNSEPLKLTMKAKLRRMAAANQLTVHDPNPEQRAGAPEGVAGNPPAAISDAEKVVLGVATLQGFSIKVD